MARTNEIWYIRFPDGRELRAANVKVIRKQLQERKLPPTIHLRRNLDDPWKGLSQFSEFTDLVEESPEGPTVSSTETGEFLRDKTATSTPISARMNPARLEMLGVRNLIEDLLGALDATLVYQKFLLALVAGLMIGGLVGLAQLVEIPQVPRLFWQSGLLCVLLLIVATLSTMLSRLSYVELAKLRPSRWKDLRRRVFPATWRLWLVYLCTCGALGFALIAARSGADWIREQGGEAELAWIMAAQVFTVVNIVLQVLLSIVPLLILPLGPLLVVESCSLRQGVYEWIQLLRQHFSRLLLSELGALSLTALLALPLVGVIWFYLNSDLRSPFQLTVQLTRYVIAGAVLSLPLAYLLVANLFIYLHLRYESIGKRNSPQGLSGSK